MPREPWNPSKEEIEAILASPETYYDGPFPDNKRDAWEPHSAFYEEDDAIGGIVGYMDAVDYQYEVGAASGGNRVHPSPEDVIRHNRCAQACGIVEVRVVGVRVIRHGDGTL